MNLKIAGRNSGNTSFLHEGRGQREKFKPQLPAEQSEKQSSIPLQKQPRLSSQDHCCANDLGKEVDFRKKVNIVTENLKTKKNSFTAGSISKCVESWKEITSDKSILQTVSKVASIKLEDLAS